MNKYRKKYGPMWTAVGGIFATPIVAVLAVLIGIGMIVMWPVIPFLLYRFRKKEIEKGKGF